MATIRSITPKFEGTVAGLKFEDGSASTDDERLIAYFTEAGYDVDVAGYEVQRDEDKPAPFIGTPMGLDVEIPPLADAADPRNSSIPVGGVKSDGTIVASAKDGDGGEVAPKPEPDRPVQETGNPDEQSAVPSSANPDGAVSTPDGVAQPQGEPTGETSTGNPSAADETGAPSADGSPSGEATQTASGGTISSDPAPEDTSGKHAADQPVDGSTQPDAKPSSSSKKAAS